MGLTDKDLDAFFIFLAKIIFTLIGLRLAIVIFGIDINVPYLDPFLDWIIAGIRDFLSGFGMKPWHVDL